MSKLSEVLELNVEEKEFLDNMLASSLVLNEIPVSSKVNRSLDFDQVVTKVVTEASSGSQGEKEEEQKPETPNVSKRQSSVHTVPPVQGGSLEPDPNRSLSIAEEGPRPPEQQTRVRTVLPLAHYRPQDSPSRQPTVPFDINHLYSNGTLVELEWCLDQLSHLPTSGNAVEDRATRSLKAMVAVKVCKFCNAVAMNYIDVKRYDMALSLLDRALALTSVEGLLADHEERDRLRVTTLNNLGCHYKHCGNPDEALQFLGRAVDLHADLSHEKVPSNLLLNLAAVLSTLGRHGEALAQCKRSIADIADVLEVDMIQLEVAIQCRCSLTDLYELIPSVRGCYTGHLNTLAMAYYNRAVEEEFLEQWDAALSSYAVAEALARFFSGKGAQIALMFRKTLYAYRLRIQKLQKQQKVCAVTTNGSEGSARLVSSRRASPSPSLSMSASAEYYGGVGRGGGRGGGGSLARAPPSVPAPEGASPGRVTSASLSSKMAEAERRVFVKALSLYDGGTRRPVRISSASRHRGGGAASGLTAMSGDGCGDGTYYYDSHQDDCGHHYNSSNHNHNNSMTWHGRATAPPATSVPLSVVALSAASRTRNSRPESALLKLGDMARSHPSRVGGVGGFPDNNGCKSSHKQNSVVDRAFLLRHKAPSPVVFYASNLATAQPAPPSLAPPAPALSPSPSSWALSQQQRTSNNDNPCNGNNSNSGGNSINSAIGNTVGAAKSALLLPYKTPPVPGVALRVRGSRAASLASDLASSLGGGGGGPSDSPSSAKKSLLLPESSTSLSNTGKGNHPLDTGCDSARREAICAASEALVHSRVCTVYGSTTSSINSSTGEVSEVPADKASASSAAQVPLSSPAQSQWPTGRSSTSGAAAAAAATDASGLSGRRENASINNKNNIRNPPLAAAPREHGGGGPLPTSAAATPSPPPGSGSCRTSIASNLSVVNGGGGRPMGFGAVSGGGATRGVAASGKRKEQVRTAMDLRSLPPVSYNPKAHKSPSPSPARGGGTGIAGGAAGTTAISPPPSLPPALKLLTPKMNATIV